ncbi:NurA domain-containing protein [Thermosyntropha lipolytica DSM 11003]|uniref:NurA domain-containing protein n=1 Tax=Thermosyntropha lipolytica DSM 11003 TaxID=1123382 RepID=A0A1M5PE41_9FIRM|nr:DNA double-strand break repair nuclease NurA [Thermosyntropha lipolytica]SHH00076.1 NurA domain-containing protein [Thermosyntropha lipolytica DSM 11003]
MWNVQMVKDLRQFNVYIKTASKAIPHREELRKALSLWGTFRLGEKIPSLKLKELLGERTIAAVDGSRIEYASFYPYSLVLLRTLGKCTGREDLEKSKVITPLHAETAALVYKKKEKEGIGEEEAYRLYLKEELAHLEILTALEIAEKYKPCLLMLDGGFLLFDQFAEWRKLYKFCLENDIILVGIIEEVATSVLAKWLDLRLDHSLRIYDREILFGLLDKGEYLLFAADKNIKKNYHTVFARLGSLPQAIGCDFLAEQREKITQAMNLLYTLTPRHGQGIPLWLQITDAKVRLRKKETEKLIENCLEPELRELFFRANRERRAF